MYRAYRLYHNMCTGPGMFHKNTHPVCIELMRVPNFFTWLLLQFEESAEGVCGMLSYVLLPKGLTEFVAEWGEDDEVMKFGDYYGEDWGAIWHCFVEMPISDYIWKHTNAGTLHIDVPLDKQWDNWHEIDWIR